jgi:hypothetical protein
VRFWRHVVAPRIATIMPVLVSPIFTVEVSTAAIIVSWWFGFRGIGSGFSCSVDENCWFVSCW